MQRGTRKYLLLILVPILALGFGNFRILEQEIGNFYEQNAKPAPPDDGLYFYNLIGQTSVLDSAGVINSVGSPPVGVVWLRPPDQSTGTEWLLADGGDAPETGYDELITTLAGNPFSFNDLPPVAIASNYIANFANGGSGDYYIYQSQGEFEAGVQSAGAAIVMKKDGVDWAFDSYIYDAVHPADDTRTFATDIFVLGDMALISTGANPTAGNFGSVQLYRLTAGVWTYSLEVGSITPSTNDGFGSAVKFDGTRMIVGAQYFNNNREGWFEVYTWNGTDFTYVQKIANNTVNFTMGYKDSIEMSGDILAVSTIHNYPGSADQSGGQNGWVNIYEWDGSLYQYITTLNSPDANTPDFGRDLIVRNDGDQILVASPSKTELSSAGGYLHIYNRTGPTSYVLAQTINFPYTGTPDIGQEWPQWIAGDDSNVMYTTFKPQNFSGIDALMYVYEEINGVWTYNQTFSPEPVVGPTANFGSSPFINSEDGIYAYGDSYPYDQVSPRLGLKTLPNIQSTTPGFEYFIRAK